VATKSPLNKIPSHKIPHWLPPRHQIKKVKESVSQNFFFEMHRSKYVILPSTGAKQRISYKDLIYLRKIQLVSFSPARLFSSRTGFNKRVNQLHESLEKRFEGSWKVVMCRVISDAFNLGLSKRNGGATILWRCFRFYAVSPTAGSIFYPYFLPTRDILISKMNIISSELVSCLENLNREYAFFWLLIAGRKYRRIPKDLRGIIYFEIIKI
jgi:hypothetical protein